MEDISLDTDNRIYQLQPITSCALTCRYFATWQSKCFVTMLRFYDLYIISLLLPLPRWVEMYFYLFHYGTGSSSSFGKAKSSSEINRFCMNMVSSFTFNEVLLN